VGIAGLTFFSLRNNYRNGGYRERLPRVKMRGNVEPAESAISARRLTEGVERTDSVKGLGKLLRAEPARGFVRFFLFGAALVAGCAFMRLRYSWWPFHPLPLIFLNTWAMSRFYQSIFLGWAIKVAILKIGGGKVYERSKPFFIGAIFGCVMGAGLCIAVASIQFALTGAEPPRIEFFT
jgi:hypothetical protein